MTNNQPPTTPLTTVAAALAWARAALSDAADSEPLDAPLLLAHVLGCERAALLAHPDRPLTPAQSVALRALVARRADGVPLAYLTGERAFYDLTLIVTPDVLIPRPETEHLVERALAWARTRGKPPRIADVGAGSGAIAVTLARHLPAAQVWALDVSRAALGVARRNAARYDLGQRIRFVQADLLGPLLGARGAFDLIVANLPYVPTSALEALPVSRHEPRLALDGGPDGLAVIRRLLAQVPRVLAADGLLLLEIEAAQGEQAAALTVEALPGARVTVHADYAGHDRVLSAEWGVRAQVDGDSLGAGH
ncbi:MAG: peptide chain release factor N(5)-glutamine methyltransferase [Anaerolineae bacterium]|nr:peptide chain release factor N(5)-glutamine methyltransferase [Anaerolineae bacterium]